MHKSIDVSTLKVADLKNHLRQRKLPLSGNKDALMKRLQEALDAESSNAQATEDVYDRSDSDKNEMYKLLHPQFTSRTELSTLDAAVLSISYNGNGDRLPMLTVFQLARMVSNSSFELLSIISPYANALYHNDDFWQYRWHLFTGGTLFGENLKPPPLPFKTWKDYVTRAFASGYVTPSNDNHTEVRNNVWPSRKQALPCLFPLEVSVSPYASIPNATRTYFGKLSGTDPNNNWLSFVNYPNSPFELLKASNSNSDADRIIKEHLPGMIEMRYLDTASMPIDQYEIGDLTIPTTVTHSVLE